MKPKKYINTNIENQKTVILLADTPSNYKGRIQQEVVLVVDEREDGWIGSTLEDSEVRLFPRFAWKEKI